MAIGRTNAGGAGGAALNFEVVGGTPVPANPKENTIWINTSTPITDWVFSAEQPEAATGRVWIFTGTSSTVEFNALKKNGIQVYPISAKQYISGKWVDKTAELYQGEKWLSLLTDLVIFEAGKGAVQTQVTATGDNGTISVSTSKITVGYKNEAAGSDVVYYTKNKINTSGYKTLRLTGKFTEIDSDEDYVGFGLMSSTPIVDNYGAQNWVSSKEIPSASSSSKTYDCPISGSGSYYFVFACAACAGEITDIRLIK